MWGPAWPAGRTLKERVGSCRDLAMLMVESCRCVGLPARFVSGYHLVDPKPERYDLHAWAEVYLPGAGWRGFDPSGMGVIDDRYIPLATSLQTRSHRRDHRQLFGPTRRGE
jgi:transglutaminase-like putative cysteine protease